jgi:uncharacterized membrane protein (DUF106 family)
MGKIKCLVVIAMLILLVSVAASPIQAQDNQRKLEDIVRALDSAVVENRKGNREAAIQSIQSAKTIYENIFSADVDNATDNKIRDAFTSVIANPAEGNILALKADILAAVGELGVFISPLHAYSLFFILLLSMGVSFFVTLVNKRTVNWELVRSHKAKISEFMKEYRDAMRKQDRKRMHKLEERRREIQRLQGELMSQQLKPTLYYIIPLMLIWMFVLGPVFGGWVVAWLPFRIDLPIYGPLVAFGPGWWYIITFFGFSTIFRALMIPETPPVAPPAAPPTGSPR